MSEERRLAVLRAIVEDYVSTREPVGSKALVDRHALGVSPATVRNDMAFLEEEGLIAQPHTSAGRIPTDKGYRLFVDRLSAVKPLSASEQRAISNLLDGAVDLDDVVNRSVRLLAQLTQQVAVVQYPSLNRSELRHVELVRLEGSRVMVVVITNTGRVEQRFVDLGSTPTEELLGELRARLNTAVNGVRLAEVRQVVADLPQRFAPQDAASVQKILDALNETLDLESEERIVLAGTSHLTRSGPDFAASISPVLDALEEHVVMLRLLQEMSEESPGINVIIGGENTHEGLQTTSLVSSGYGSHEVVARMGVLGPTRMDYASSMAAVRAVARYVSRIIAANQ